MNEIKLPVTFDEAEMMVYDGNEMAIADVGLYSTQDEQAIIIGQAIATALNSAESAAELEKKVAAYERMLADSVEIKLRSGDQIEMAYGRPNWYVPHWYIYRNKKGRQYPTALEAFESLRGKE
jgi:hypothetical protein